MKYIALLLAAFAILPLSNWARRNEVIKATLVGFVGFLPFGISLSPYLDIAVVSWQGWSGYVGGVEITAFDLAIVCLAFAMPKAKRTPSFLLPLLGYCFVVVISAMQSHTPQASLFYAWQILRITFAYFVIARLCVDPRVIAWLLTGMTVGLVLEAGVVMWQRLALGIVQATGTFEHQNLLGMMANFVTFPLWALLLTRQGGWPAILAPLAGLIVVALGVSRAALALFGAGLSLVLALSWLRARTAAKTRVALMGVLIVGITVPLVQSSLYQRFVQNPLSDEYDERAALERAAAAMLTTYPMGVGANTFVVTANTEGFYERAGVVFTSGAAHVHNLYWLAATETGYIGVLLLAIVLFMPLRAALLTGWNLQKDPRGDLLLGLGASLTLVYIHSFFEWVFVLKSVQYMFAIALGMISGVETSLRERKP